MSGLQAHSELSQHVWPGGGPEDPDMHDDIDFYYRRGYSDNQVARAVGCHSRTVFRHRHSRGQTANRPTGRDY